MPVSNGADKYTNSQLSQNVGISYILLCADSRVADFIKDLEDMNLQLLLYYSSTINYYYHCSASSYRVSSVAEFQKFHDYTFFFINDTIKNLNKSWCIFFLESGRYIIILLNHEHNRYPTYSSSCLNV